ncbi:MAG TPA: hypothetical protein VM617_04635, partial [Thermoanaerobaculia bacterium]|nr:hypothetical protein [Thermoanaerobaculia bacterium]
VGDWSGRAFARLPESGEIARFCLRDLLAWDWLLFWPILAIGWLVAIFLRCRPAVALGAAVSLQLLIYGATALVTYLDPIPHLEAAFFRITAALVPLGLLALASLVAPSPDVPARPSSVGRGGDVVPGSARIAHSSGSRPVSRRKASR